MLAGCEVAMWLENSQDLEEAWVHGSPASHPFTEVASKTRT